MVSLITRLFSAHVTDLLSILVLSVMTIWAVSALFTPGFFTTHDGDYHIVRTMRMHEQLSAGVFPVRIVPELASGQGYPVFLFFYPLPYYLASMGMFVGLSAVSSWKIMLIIMTFLSGVLMYSWLRNHFSSQASLIGSLIYLLAPYRFLTLFVTQQIGAVFSFVCAPLLLLGLYLVIKKSSSWGGVFIALATSLFLTSHVLSAIMFIPIGIVYGGYLLYFEDKWNRRILHVLGWGLLGIGLASFYLLPLAGQKHWVIGGQQVLIDYHPHWPTLKQLFYAPWGYGYSREGTADGLSFQVGFGIWASVFLMVGLLVRKYLFKKILGLKLPKERNIFAVVFGGLFILYVLLSLQFSEVVWNHLPMLSQLQYPWRLLAPMLFCGSILAAWVVENFPGRWVQKGVILFLFLLTVINVRNYRRSETPDRYQDNHYQENGGLFSGTTDISGELTPIWVTPPHHYYSTTLFSYPESLVSQYPMDGDVLHRRKSFQLMVEKDVTAVLPLWYLPSWQVTLDGQPVLTQLSDQGYIQFPIPAGSHTMHIAVVRTPLEKVGDGISLISIIFLTLYLSRITILSKAKLFAGLTRINIFPL